MQLAHVIDFAHPGCKNGARQCQAEIVKFVKGIRRPRKTPVTEKQICIWMKATPDEFVKEQITEACIAGKIHIRRKNITSGIYVYEA